MKEVLADAEKAASFDIPVLILGRQEPVKKCCPSGFMNAAAGGRAFHPGQLCGFVRRLA